MKAVFTFLFIRLLVLFFSCKENDIHKKLNSDIINDSTKIDNSSKENDSITTTKSVKINGFIQKGPYLSGSSITIQFYS